VRVCGRSAERDSRVDDHAFSAAAFHADLDGDHSAVSIDAGAGRGQIHILLSLAFFRLDECRDEVITPGTFSGAAGVLRPGVVGNFVRGPWKNREGKAGLQVEVHNAIFRGDDVNPAIWSPVLNHLETEIAKSLIGSRL